MSNNGEDKRNHLANILTLPQLNVFFLTLVGRSKE